MFWVYILYSPSRDLFYTGYTTLTAEERLDRHLKEYYGSKFTASVKDWELFYQLECISTRQAIQIEKHIKRMKSKKYITDLKRFPTISQNLLIKYADVN
jgi:putative endonuclease